MSSYKQLAVRVKQLEEKVERLEFVDESVRNEILIYLGTRSKSALSVQNFVCKGFFLTKREFSKLIRQMVADGEIKVFEGMKSEIRYEIDNS